MRGIRLPTGTWAALVFLLVSAYFWAARGPGSAAIYRLPVLQAQAQWAVGAALFFACWALFFPRNHAGLGVLLLAAASLAVARSPLPRKPIMGNPRPVELHGRLLRWSSNSNGGCWGLIDCVSNVEGKKLAPPSKRYLFTTASDYIRPLPGSHLHLRGLLVPTMHGHQLRNCLVRPLPLSTAISIHTQFRGWARQQLQQNLPPPHRELASALLLGERGGMDPFQLSSYRQLGLLHLLAISGMHFWVWSAALRRLLPGRLKFARPPILFLVAALADFSAPVVRALTAIFLRDLLAARGRGIASHQLWALALWVEIAALPYQPTSLGLILTYLATGSLILGQPPSSAPLWRKLLQPSICAFLGTTAVLHAFQGTLEPWSIPLTPLLGLLMPLRLFASAAALAPGYAPISLWIFEHLASWEEGFLHWANRLPGTPMYGLAYDNASLFLCSALALFAFAKTLRCSSTQKFALVLPLIAMLCFPRQGNPSFLALPVGHGLAGALIGHRRTLLFDIGSAELRPQALVDRVFMPTLNRENASSATSLVLSHADQDHTNGVPALRERLKFDLLSCAPGTVEKVPNMDPFEVYLIGCPLAGSSSSNEGGHVLDVRGPEGRMVLLGDQFGFGLRALKELLTPGPIEVLLLPHHGLTTEGLPELLDHLSPKNVWASCGRMDFPLPVSALIHDRGLLLETTSLGPLRWPK